MSVLSCDHTISRNKILRKDTETLLISLKLFYLIDYEKLDIQVL